MQPSPLRHAVESSSEFPFAQSPSSSHPPTRIATGRTTIGGGEGRGGTRSRQGSSSTKQLSQLFGKGWQGDDEELVKHHEAEQKGFGEKRELLVRALDETTGLVKGLASFNQDKWTIHYPHELGVTTSTSASTPPQRSQSSTAAPETPARSRQQGHALRRSASLYMDDTNHDAATAGRPVPQRAYSTAETPVKAATVAKDSTPAHPLSILSLDLKLGHPATSTQQLPALLPSLSLSTLSQLLSRRLATSLGHLNQLRSRVIDTNSRILVTGDLNAGKSTFVNALLRREVMPWDQQPCTTVFCEVMDAGNNDDKEEMHAIRNVDKYDRNDRSTYDVYPLEQVYEVQDMGDAYEMVKAYVHDGRAPARPDDANPSFIKNGLVSISLIDAPGLNRDTLSTTALFARQSEIDVIVFVVSAENHFTLSAKEFLWNASREKAYVFIVVNKWNGIRDKAKCMRVVGEQIKQLSPATWDNRAELVHFVDAADYVDSPDEEAKAQVVVEGVEVDEEPSAFDHLEQSLRSFVLLKRSKSKLAPAKHYLLNLLADLSTLAGANTIAANSELASALRELERIRPIHERLSAQRDEVEHGVDEVEESVVEVVKNAAWARLERALGYVTQGQVVPPPHDEEGATTTEPEPRPTFDGVESIAAPTSLPPYPGLLGIWDWAADVKATLVRALEAEVRAAEDDARVETVAGVKQVMQGLGDKYLPSVAGGDEAQPEPSNEANKKAKEDQQARVFRPEVMFAKRRRGVGRLAARGVSTGLGLGQAGLGINWTASEFDVSFLDLFDLERMYSHGNLLSGRSGSVSSSSSKHKMIEDDVVEKGTIVGLGLGSIGMVGSRFIGIKGTMESLNKIVQLVGSKTARKWAGPVIGVLTVGLVVYVIVDLPRAIPRNIGRKLALSLSASPESLPSSASPPITFSSAHSDRIARETRKVLRLAGWDLRERFRAALDKSAAERKEVEGVVERAQGALKFLEEFEDKVERQQDQVQVIEL
ncbi:hypothetical protein JCM10212_004999 [Sporobolomyces blumeae]